MKTLLLAPKPREINSFKYREHGITQDAEVFRDHAWAPAINQFETGGFESLYRRILELYTDEVFEAVILDPFTDVVTLAVHDLIGPERVGTIKDVRDSMGVYGALKHRLKDFTQALTGLTSPTLAVPKHVIMTVHAQPTKEDQQLSQKQGGGTKESSDNRGQGIEFMGEALPMVEGSYRREIAGEFDVVGFTRLEHRMERVGNKMERVAAYVVQLNADAERHAKAAIVPRLAEASLPNSMPAIFKAIEEAGGVAMRGGLSFLFVGPPGTGKSWLAGTIAEVEREEAAV